MFKVSILDRKITPDFDLNVNLTVSDQLVNPGIDICNKVLPTQTFLNKRNYGRCLNPRTPKEIKWPNLSVPK